MKISHIEHLGIAVQSIEESLPFFTGPPSFAVAR